MTAKDLKNALLQEAVQGKLVPQIASEGNARDLLEEIRKERLSHGFANSYGICDGKDKKTKKSDLRSKSQISVTKKELPEITEDEIPFEIPENWCWCRLGDCVNVQSSKRVFEKDYVNSGIPFYRSKEIGELSKGNQINTELFITNEHYKKLKETVGLPQKGDILLCSIGGSIGNTWINDGRDFYYKDGNVTQICNNKFIDTIFINYYLHSDLFTKQVKSEVAGSAYNALTIIKIKNLLFPLPPLAEQKRIVATIEKFMPLIEEYGKKQAALEAVNASIGTLTKKAILQEAVQGKLVPQINTEGNAKDLLEEIRKERLSHGFANSYGICDGKNKKTKKRDLRSKSQISVTKKELPEITEDEILFDIPENWCWCRITDIATCELGKTKDALKNKGEMKDYLCSINIQEEGIDLSKVKQMKFEESEFERYTVKKNDLLICEGGDAGRCAIYDRDEPMYYQNALHRVRFFCDLNPKFYLYVFQVYKANKILTEASKGVTIQHLTGAALKELCFPLPPLAEQKRIVKAIENLLPLCEALKI